MTTVTKIQIFLAVLILGFLTGPRVIQALQKNSPDSNESATISQNNITTRNPYSTAKSILVPPSSYSALHLEAKSVYVWDILNHKKLYGMNEYAQLPLASVTKMMTAIVATEILPENSMIMIHPEDLLIEGDSGLYANEAWKFNELLDFTLISSSNDGASAIANAAGAMLTGASSTDRLLNKKMFISKMNAKAREIGLENSRFLNESGLDVDKTISGAYGSARDISMLLEYVFLKHPSIFNSTTYARRNFRSENNILHHVTNTNPDVARINGIIGSKTGYTDLAGGNLVVVVDIGINHPVVIAVLGSTYEGRFADVEQLLRATVLEITKNSSIK